MVKNGDLIMVMFIVNGEICEFVGDFIMFVFWYLCDEFNLIGFKFGCGMV